ncbi:PTS sugar transporter subunit IIA [Niallia sp. HCP3S3_B10]|uniref:PTS sugar transporter subunit IIA n=1 Tax=Niallia sp. HCP3S3_B10 TaxID=3438944 RepID=UPI003F890087
MKIGRDAVQNNLQVDSIKELFEALSAPLLENNYVRPEFAENVYQRELQFPTGIPTSSIGVAMPHTDAIHVIENAISIGVLKQPVSFKMMGNPEEEVQVQLVFLLALNQAEKHLSILQKLMSVFRNEKVLQSMLASDKEELYHIVNELFQ